MTVPHSSVNTVSISLYAEDFDGRGQGEAKKDLHPNWPKAAESGGCLKSNLNPAAGKSLGPTAVAIGNIP